MRVWTAPRAPTPPAPPAAWHRPDLTEGKRFVGRRDGRGASQVWAGWMLVESTFASGR